MKRKLPAILLSIVALAQTICAQDIIIKTNRDEIKALMTTSDSECVRYKKPTNPSGPFYVLRRSDVFMIKYEDGERVIFGRNSSAHVPVPAGEEKDYQYQTPEMVITVHPPQPDAPLSPDDEYVQCCIGMAYDQHQNPEEAIKWYRKAAEQGNPDAMHYLAIAFEAGKGVDKDAAEAEKWRHKAARPETPPAKTSAPRYKPPLTVPLSRTYSYKVNVLVTAPKK
jgi:hypothetical protein